MYIFNKKNNVEYLINKRGVFKLCLDNGETYCELYKLNIKLKWIDVEEEDVWGEV